MKATQSKVFDILL